MFKQVWNITFDRKAHLFVSIAEMFWFFACVLLEKKELFKACESVHSSRKNIIVVPSITLEAVNDGCWWHGCIGGLVSYRWTGKVSKGARLSLVRVPFQLTLRAKSEKKKQECCNDPSIVQNDEMNVSSVTGTWQVVQKQVCKCLNNFPTLENVFFFRIKLG